ncbi:MAG: succinate dehydrogenase, cytochrome b556 subunit [Nitrospinota bacterium]
MRYKGHLGFIAWLFHRISGVAIVLYLILHVMVMRNLTAGPEGFNRTMAQIQAPVFVLGELALLIALIYHSFNGIRITIVDFGTGYWAHKKIFWALMAAGVVVFIIGGYPILELARAKMPPELLRAIGK